MDKKTTLVRDIYEISDLLRRPSNSVCFVKVIIFFVLDAIAVMFPRHLATWPKLLWGLIVIGFAYTGILIATMTARVFTREVVSVKILWRLAAGILFLIEYTVVPIKTLCLIAMMNEPGFILVLVAADWIFTLTIAQFAVYFLRHKRPNKDYFFSVLMSPAEVVLTTVFPLRAVALAVIATSQASGALTALRFIVIKVCGAAAMSSMLRMRPFFCPLAEITFPLCILLSSIVTGAHTTMGSFASALRLATVLGALSFLAIRTFLSLPVFPEFVPREGTNFSEIRHLLLGGRQAGELSAQSDQMREHMLLHRKLVLMFAKTARTNIKNTFTQGSLAVFKSVMGATGVKQSELRTPENKDDSKMPKRLAQNHSQTVNAPALSVFSRRGDEDQSKTKEPSYLEPSAITPQILSIADKKEPVIQLPETDKIFDDLIIENYLGGDQVGYPAYLYLIWVLDHKLSFGKLLGLLTILKNHRRRFRNLIYYYAAKREVELKLTQLLNHTREDLKSAHKHLLLKKLAYQGAPSSMQKSGAAINTPEGLGSANEKVDISEAFYLKGRLIELSDNIRLYSKLNTEYVEQLTASNQDLWQRSLMVQRLWRLDKTIRSDFERLDAASTEQSFQHLIPYFYHAYLNANRHKSASRVKADISKKFRAMKTAQSKNVKRVSLANYINECVLLSLESQRNKFGTILDIYGKTDMIFDDPLEILGNSYTVFMNESLKNFHKGIVGAIYDDDLGGQENISMTMSRPGFMKVPFRSIILPCMVKVSLCPFHSSGFKFMVAIKPDFTDDKLYIALDDLLRIDGYSSTFLPVIKEDFLRPDLPLQMLSTNVHALITNFSHLESGIGKNKTGIDKLSRKKIGAKNTARLHVENKTANFFIEDARSARSVLNSASQSGMRSDQPSQWDMTREIVLDERLQFFHAVDSSKEPLQKSFKILLKHHSYPNKLLKAMQPLGYWYMCLTPNKEAGAFADLNYVAQPADRLDVEIGLVPAKQKDRANLSPSEGKIGLTRLEHH